VSRPTPLLDFFRRGEVARDVRMQAAEGALAPTAHEQVEILLLLTGDTEAEIRAAAELTIGRIPIDALPGDLSDKAARHPNGPGGISKSLGKWLGNRVGRWAGGFAIRLAGETRDKAKTWQIVTSGSGGH